MNEDQQLAAVGLALRRVTAPATALLTLAVIRFPGKTAGIAYAFAYISVILSNLCVIVTFFAAAAAPAAIYGALVSVLSAAIAYGGGKLADRKGRESSSRAHIRTS